MMKLIDVMMEMFQVPTYLLWNMHWTIKSKTLVIGLRTSPAAPLYNFFKSKVREKMRQAQREYETPIVTAL